MDAPGADITVQITRPNVNLVDVATTVYRRTVNEVPAPFYGYTTGDFARDNMNESFGFVVRDDSHRDAPGMRGIVYLHQDQSSGRVIVFTAVWPFETPEEDIEARLRNLAARQSLTCS